MLKAKTVSEFVQKKLKDGLSARYVCDILTLLKSIFRYANREYHIANILDGVVMPKREKPEIKIFSKSEQNRLMNYVKFNRNFSTLGVALSLYTGLRIGKLCALKWENIDIEKRTLTVRNTIQRIQNFDSNSKTKVIITELKSRTSKRIIPIPDCLISTLRELKRKYPQIKLHMVLPCCPKEQSERWTDRQKSEYFSILRSADSIERISENYFSGCMKVRNAGLMELADCCFCYYDPARYRSGTGQTVRMAERKEIINFFEDKNKCFEKLAF